jgi:D-alanyl-D-alanine carboxypeptidase/D-alanyl-D-alanine-endopeptidase (penicillin-binding protein 4)
VLAGLDGAEAWPAVRALRPELDGRAPRDLALRFGDRDGKARAPALHHTLVAHRSPPLVTIVKALNGYSNNVFHPLSETIGGPAAVEALARASVPPEVGRSEIVIDNAAGAGETNRLSPRAAAALLDALAAELAAHGLGLPDVMPVAGIDPGTLRERLDDPASRGAVVAKTGTFGSLGACALVGVIRTREYGDVTFAVLNRNLPVPEARRRQDAFVRAVIAAAGSAPFPYRGDGAAPLAEALVERVP